MNLAQAVAKRIAELLKKQNKTQYKLIKETCLDKSTIQNIMKNRTKDVKISTLFLIADFFHMTISEFTNTPYFSKQNIDI